MGFVYYRSEILEWLTRLAGPLFYLFSRPLFVGSMSFRAFSSLVYLEWHEPTLRCHFLPTSLVVLDVSGSYHMSTLPRSLMLGALTGLQHLNLGTCGLRTVPESLGALTALRQLDLSCDSLSALPEWFGVLTGLQQLDLSYNRYLAALPECFGRLTGLQQLGLTGCKSLTALPESFTALTGLQQLRLFDCPAGHSGSLRALSGRMLRISLQPEVVPDDDEVLMYRSRKFCVVSPNDET